MISAVYHGYKATYQTNKKESEEHNQVSFPLKTLYCLCSLESPCRGNYNEHPQYLFLWRNKQYHSLISSNTHHVCSYMYLASLKNFFTVQLISTFVFTTKIVQCLYFLNPKCQASSVVVQPVGTRRQVFLRCGSYEKSCQRRQILS